MLSVLNLRSKLSCLRMTSLICFSLLFVIAGCGSGEKDVPIEEQNSSSARLELKKKRQCSKNFSSVHQILRPEPENMNTELQSALSLLNQWYGSCAEWSGEKLSVDDPIVKAALSNEQINNLNKQTASLYDILYLRDQLLMRAVMEHVVESIPTDIEKIRQIFAYTQRNVTHDPLLIDARFYHFLQSRFPEAVPKQALSELVVPRTLQDIILSGRGSGEDLTWVFVSLIRQLNIDAIMVSPSENEKIASNLPAIILVPIGEKILVFCPAAGLEFQPQDKTITDGWSAEELSKDFNQIFASTIIESKKTIVTKLNDINWKQSKLFFPYGPLRIAPRSEALQMELVGDLACEVFESLQSLNGEPGLIERTSAVRKKIFSDTSINLWKYPYQMYGQIIDATDASRQLRNIYLATINKSVQAIRTNRDQADKVTFKTSLVKRMQISRINQILGNEADAISSYMKLRLQGGVAGGASAELQQENLLRLMQIEDAQYWSALCQFETKDYRIAAQTFKNYLQRFPQGRWQSSALELLADAQANRQQFKSAADVFGQATLSSPRQARQLLKLKNWKEQASK